jgi:hypothetical protein
MEPSIAAANRSGPARLFLLEACFFLPLELAVSDGLNSECAKELRSETENKVAQLFLCMVLNQRFTAMRNCE